MGWANIPGQTGGATLTAQQPENNIVRTALKAESILRDNFSVKLDPAESEWLEQKTKMLSTADTTYFELLSVLCLRDMHKDAKAWKEQLLGEVGRARKAAKHAKKAKKAAKKATNYPCV